MNPPDHCAYIALGSNIGDREQNIVAAIGILNSHPNIQVLTVSQLIETEAVGGPAGQSKYLNGAARLKTSLGSRELLSVLLETERRLGRDRSSAERNLPRTLDLDLLLYDELIIDEPGLQVPHPRLHQRDFVLRPLARIAPEAVHPILRKKIRELLSTL